MDNEVFEMSAGHRLIQETSRRAYREIRQDGTGITSLEKVYVWIVTHPNCCNREISEGTGLPINNVTARCMELRNVGFARCAGRKVDVRTGKLVLGWEDAHMDRQAKLPAFIYGVPGQRKIAVQERVKQAILLVFGGEYE